MKRGLALFALSFLGALIAFGAGGYVVYKSHRQPYKIAKSFMDLAQRCQTAMEMRSQYDATGLIQIADTSKWANFDEFGTYSADIYATPDQRLQVRYGSGGQVYTDASVNCSVKPIDEAPWIGETAVALISHAFHQDRLKRIATDEYQEQPEAVLYRKNHNAFVSNKFTDRCEIVSALELSLDQYILELTVSRFTHECRGAPEFKFLESSN